MSRLIVRRKPPEGLAVGPHGVIPVAVDPAALPAPSRLSEAALLRGYSVLGRRATQPRRYRTAAALRRLHTLGGPFPESLLLRGRRCPCGGHEGPMSSLEERQRRVAALTIAAERDAEEVAS